MTDERFVVLLSEIFGAKRWPKPLHLLQAAIAVDGGRDLGGAAKTAATSRGRLEAVVGSDSRVRHLLGAGVADVDERNKRKATQVLGQLLLGRCAELAFEEIYRAEMHAHELELRDVRESRTDTDYRLYNGKGHPIYRINIKFHGARFRRASELVGLEPPDCFALATYKIFSALRKQEDEGLPYLFAVVGVPHLTGEVVGGKIPTETVDATALIHQAPRATGKRDFEDAIIDHLVRAQHRVFVDTRQQIVNVDWFILSACKANKLLRERRFDRVYALRIHGFAQQFRGAELDMHFSLSNDLVPLREFLRVLWEEGMTKVTTLMERGDF